MTTNIRHLNFLDEKEVASKNIFKLNYLWMIVIVTLFTGAALSFSYYQKHRLVTIQDEITAVSAELTQLRSQQLRKQQESLSASARKEVLGDPILWSDLLKKMAKKIPEAVKLNLITGSISNKRTLVLKGISAYVLPIYRLKDNFAELQECSKPNLVSIEQAQLSAGEQQLSFQMECTLS